ncbi:DUF4390 domain-containing protein [Desulfopila inferna]|uniref:DUF4390 domain-containing protein n=1 Tax=Desulfopila inferna TaxID=468528 RepID=UPI001966B51D|nr:DUF4390 domain-containing protein [Desulfopila inferna]MBM9604330.1 DUF4390 domain-containing protein [Desulfopila inferna]
MKKTLLLTSIILVLLLLSVQTSISIPKRTIDPAFSDITVTGSKSHLLLFAMLKNAFTEEMLQGLHSGLPIHFSFFIELSQADSENSLISLETRHVISYDTLKETYKVEIEESGKRFFSYQSLDEAQKAINELNGLKVVELNRLQPDTPYTIRIRAELYKKTLPMGLHRVVPFISWWDIKTKWHSITFTI